jgi:toxin ParE1/3/4
MRDLRVLAEVYRDLAETTDYYFERGGNELSNRLIGSFETTLGKLQVPSEILRPVYHTFRRVLLKPFPYKLYYTIENEFVVVILMIHVARSPALGVFLSRGFAESMGLL